MSEEGTLSVEISENEVHENVTVAQENDRVKRNLAKENGSSNGMGNPNLSYDDLLQKFVELNFQNDYMKSQFEGLRNHLQVSVQSENDNSAVCKDDVEKIRSEIESLKREVAEEKQTRVAAEEALKHLNAAHLEADTKAQELSAQLVEAQQKMEQEIKERDDKYSDLESKLNRLHKRAKQRIQDVQKEKEDLEAEKQDLQARFHDVNEKAERATSQLSALQQELDRTRQHANEALKAIDMERQQLRSANNKLRDEIEELRHSLGPKEQALETIQQSLLEKEQMVENMRGLLEVADEKRQASIAELNLKHQKQVGDMEAQIAEIIAERSKAIETISSLRAIIAEKDSKIAEMDAASSGEAARLSAAMESLKGELGHMKIEHEKEKEGLEVALQSIRSKLEISESNRIHAELEAAKLRSQFESEFSVQTQLLNNKDSELEEAKKKIDHIQNEFANYKVRAHALLQKKEAELVAAKDNEQVRTLEEALKDAEREISLLSAEKDKALQDLTDALTNCEKEISNRDLSLSMAQQQIKNLQSKVDSVISLHQSEKDAWERNLQNVEETWRLRCEALTRQSDESSGQNFQKELEELKLSYKKLKEEQSSFHDLADKMMEEKDREISRLLDENKILNQQLESRPSVDDRDAHTAALQRHELMNSSTSAAEQQILILARQQAQREEELAQTQRHILALQEEIEELEHENRLHRQQEAMLKEELRNMDRTQKREGVDLTYLKNVVLKLLETGEVERLLPVIAMLLQFSPDEVQKCQQAYRASTEALPSPSSESSSSQSLFSRFSFT